MKARRALFFLVPVATVIVSLVVARNIWFSRAFAEHIRIARSGQKYVDAIAAFHAQVGRYPSSLQELVPTFLSDPPTNDVVKGWVYGIGPADTPHRGFLLWKHGVLPHTYVQYQSSGMVANIVPPPPVGWVENLEGRVTRLNIEPDGPAKGSQPFSSETNRTSAAAGSRR